MKRSEGQLAQLDSMIIPPAEQDEQSEKLPPLPLPAAPPTDERSEMDCGYAWVILVAAFFTHLIVFGMMLCFGIYFITLMDYFGSSRSKTAMVGSLTYGIFALSGPVASVLSRRFGCRFTVILGGSIASFGAFLSYFAASIGYLCVTFGLFVGFGFGLCYTPTLGILPQYFDRLRFFATAIVTVGSATGTLIFSPAYYYFIQTYTWQGSMLINCCVLLQLIVFGALLKSRTIDRHASFKSLLELSLFREGAFICLIVGCFLWGGAIYIYFSMNNDLAIAIGISKMDSTLLVMVTGICNVIGRVSSSIIGHFDCTHRALFYATTTLIYALATLLAPSCQSFTSLAIVNAIFGLHYGGMLAQLAGTIIEQFGVAKLINGLGYAMMSLGLGGLIVPPVGASLADAYGVGAAYYFAGICAVIGSILAYLMIYCHQNGCCGPDDESVPVKPSRLRVPTSLNVFKVPSGDTLFEVRRRLRFLGYSESFCTNSDGQEVLDCSNSSASRQSSMKLHNTTDSIAGFDGTPRNVMVILDDSDSAASKKVLVDVGDLGEAAVSPDDVDIRKFDPNSGVPSLMSRAAANGRKQLRRARTGLEGLVNRARSVISPDEYDGCPSSRCTSACDTMTQDTRLQSDRSSIPPTGHRSRRPFKREDTINSDIDTLPRETKPRHRTNSAPGKERENLVKKYIDDP